MFILCRFLFLIGFLIAASLGLTGRAQGPTEKSTPDPAPSSGVPSRGLVPADAEAGPTDYRAKYAIIIGISKYKGEGLEPLLFAENDAREVRNTLQGEFGYPPDRIFSLSDDAATRGEVRHVLEEEIVRHNCRPTTPSSSSSPVMG